MSTEKTNARNRHAAPIGLVFIVLCVIGLCTVFNWCYGLTRNLADNTAQKTKYEQMLLPVVMFDPPDFTDPATCDNEFLLQSSLWACMLGERRGSYEFDEYGRMVIPAADVDAQAVSLFGQNIKLEHMTIGDMENAYQYDSDIASYHVPIIAMTAHAMNGDREKSLSVGMQDYIAKPIEPSVLLSTLARWIHRDGRSPRR